MANKTNEEKMETGLNVAEGTPSVPQNTAESSRPEARTTGQNEVKAKDDGDKVVGVVLPPHTAMKIEASDEQKAARDDAKTRLAPEIAAAKELAKRRELMLTPSDDATVSITLKKDHTHAGVAYKADDTIKVDEMSAKFIEEQGVGER